MSTTLKSFDALPRPALLAASASAVGVALLGPEESRFVRYPAEQSAPVKRKELHLDELEGLSPAQRSMYERITKGLALYSPEQLAGMSSKQQAQIVRDHKRYKHLLHRLKQQRMPETKLIGAIWPHLSIGERYTDVDIDSNLLDPKHKLGITTATVVEMLIAYKLLPASFHHLRPEGLAGE